MLPTHLLPIQSVQPPHCARVQLDGVRDVGEHLLKGVCGLLVEQYPHRLAGFDATPDNRDQFGFDVVFGLAQVLTPRGGEG